MRSRSGIRDSFQHVNESLLQALRARRLSPGWFVAWEHVCEAAARILHTSHKNNDLPLLHARVTSNGAVLLHAAIAEIYPGTD